MGVFDYLAVEMPLPDGQADEGHVYQTKDTPVQFMENHTITKDGRLIHHTVRRYSTPKDKLPYPDAEPGTLLALGGIISSEPAGDVDLEWHGYLHFIGRAKDYKEYRAKFTDGCCVKIERLDD